MAKQAILRAFEEINTLQAALDFTFISLHFLFIKTS